MDGLGFILALHSSTCVAASSYGDIFFFAAAGLSVMDLVLFWGCNLSHMVDRWARNRGTGVRG